MVYTSWTNKSYPAMADLGGWKYYSPLKRRIDTSDFQKIRLCTIG
ncbi:MAG: hypothetical protein NTW31_00860 [Bacteroidetes bacterium]|nr:hypothetical protein [Bacteroidota bacterium]